MQDVKEKPENTAKKKPNRTLTAILIIAIILMFLMELFGSACFYLSIFGVPCAGCGTTRAATLLFNGRVSDALRMHPLIFVTLFLLVAIPLTAAIRWVMQKKGRPFPLNLSGRFLNGLLVSVAILYLAVYIVRMIVLFPHTEPMIYHQGSVLGRVISFFKGLFVR